MKPITCTYAGYIYTGKIIPWARVVTMHVRRTIRTEYVRVTFICTYYIARVQRIDGADRMRSISSATYVSIVLSLLVYFRRYMKEMSWRCSRDKKDMEETEKNYLQTSWYQSMHAWTTNLIPKNMTTVYAYVVSDLHESTKMFTFFSYYFF